MKAISIAAALIAFSVAVSAMAGDSDGTKRCLQLSRISSVNVIDNQHIRFEMNGGPDYMNTLPHTCPGLSKYDPILYKTSLHELCDLDTITVLDQVGGGFMQGASCGLGKFVPIEEAQEGTE